MEEVSRCVTEFSAAKASRAESAGQTKALKDAENRWHDELLTAMENANVESVELPSGETLQIEKRLKVSKR